MSKLLSEFIYATDQLVKYHATTKEVVSERNSTLSTLSARINELKLLWANVKLCHENCARSEEADEGDEEKLDMNLIDSKFCFSNESYVACYGLLLDFENKIKPKPIQPSPASNAAETKLVNIESNTSYLKLPPCDTESFKGDYLSWPSFRDMFDALYVQHPKLCKVQKLFHLRAKTEGEAHNIVAKFPLTNSSFELAWEALRATYENTRLLINNQIKIIFSLPLVHEETPTSIKLLLRSINDCLTALKSHGVDTSHWDPILIYACSNRLPPASLALWEQSIQDPTALPSWDQLNKFLSVRYQVLESISDISTTSTSLTLPRHNDKPTGRQNRTFNTFVTKSNSFACRLCATHHPIRLCPVFQNMNVSSRTEFVMKHGMCINCLAYNHQKRECVSRFSCAYCKGRHNSLLHPNTTNPNSSSSFLTQQSVPEQTSVPTGIENSHTSNKSLLQFNPAQNLTENNQNTFCTFNHQRVLLATALVSIISKGLSCTVRALIDPASEVSFISGSVQQRLNLPVERIDSTISGISSAFATSVSKRCTFHLGNHNCSETTFIAKALVLKKIASNLPSTSFQPIPQYQLKDIPLADPTYNRSSQIDLLIGADLYPVIIQEGLVHLSNSLVAQKTIFGWILSGPLPPSFNVFTTCVSTSNTSLENQLRKFWEVEEVLPTPTISDEDASCENLYQNSTYRSTDGRYVVRLPFKSDFPSKINLGYSRNIALKLFVRNERTLAKNQDFRIKYNAVIDEYTSLNHMKTSQSEEHCISGTVSSFYLPHHAIQKPESSSTKIRVVFNASNASSNGTSLNDVLLTGPRLQRDLTALMLRWRFYKYVFNADIEKMYRQIWVHPEDSVFQRILFRRAEEEPIETHELQTVTFGVNCVPFLALRTLKQLALDIAHCFPLAASIIQKEFYVDDVLSGAHDLPTAKIAQIQLINALNSAGFPLRKWTANSPFLLDHLPREHILNESFLKLEEDSTVKTLGIRWNAQGDNFYFITQSPNLSESPTKRDILSQIARLFDPAGWLAPVLITSKILMQQTWIDKTSWDEKLPENICSKWLSFVNNLSEIKSIRVPRWVNYDPALATQIHGFCDASEKAFAATLYVRVAHPDGSFNVNLLVAKTKVAPVKSLSLPRLELCGALLLSKLIKLYLPELPLESYQLFCWTDSSIVIAWLQKPPCSWKSFIANRTSQIIENVGVVEWKHVRSSDNPADLATRGISAVELNHCDLWWQGPAWLKDSESHWPISLPTNPPEQVLEPKPVVSFVTQVGSDILERFSSYPRALRVIAFIFRFYNRVSKKIKAVTPDLTSVELNFVKTRLILLTQQEFFAQERKSLCDGKPVHTKSSILSLNPMLDTNNLLRVNGRLANSDIPFNERHPIILPYSSHLSNLIVQFIHKITLHGGNSLMLRQVRQEFWIPKAKNIIRFCILKCKTCIIHKQKLRQQIMAALPAERCNFSPPFTYTGIDFAGPFDIKSSFGRNSKITKGYVCLYVCFSTKAIHLEPCSDLSTRVFLAAFARFVARRGLPKEIFSDHGTNFVGADSTIRRDLKTLIASIPSQISSQYSIHCLSWSFIPPGAPHMGGLWEAGVKSFKTHFKKVASATKFSFEEFGTLLCRIEACLNSRPISPMSDDPSDTLALTPGHFLRGGPLLALPEPDVRESPLSLINRWEKIKLLQQKFSVRWKNEYVSDLQKRNKWQFPKENLKINDLVVVKSDNLPPTEWRLGRVMRVHAGPDGRVRVAVVRTQLGEITRPIVKLCALPM